MAVASDGGRAESPDGGGTDCDVLGSDNGFNLDWVVFCPDVVFDVLD